LLVKEDLDRYPLYDLCEIAGCIIRRQHAEFGSVAKIA